MIRFDFRQKGKIELQTDTTKAMSAVSQIMKRSIELTIRSGGPNWIALKSGGETPLVGSGRLFRSINARSGDRWAEVGAGAGLPYAWIQHKGGMTHPNVTEKSRKFFWAMYEDTGNEMWKAMALTKKKKFSVSIPARPYMVLHRDDLAKIGKLLGSFIVKSPRGEDAIF